MAKRLTDKQRKKIIADYIDCGNYSAAAKKNGVSRTTVKNIIASDSESCEKLHRKKEQNTADILAYMESRKDAVCGILELYLDALTAPEKIEKATLPQIATSMGILIDKSASACGKSGVIRGDENGRLGLTENFVKTITILDRAGVI